MVDALAHAGSTTAKLSTVPWPANPTLREFAETRHQLDEPFVTDSALTE